MLKAVLDELEKGSSGELSLRKRKALDRPIWGSSLLPDLEIHPLLEISRSLHFPSLPRLVGLFAVILSETSRLPPLFLVFGSDLMVCQSRVGVGVAQWVGGAGWRGGIRHAREPASAHSTCFCVIWVCISSSSSSVSSSELVHGIQRSLITGGAGNHDN